MYKHGVAPRPERESEMGGFELFASGRVGMMINNPSAVNQYRPIQAFKWNIGALPLGTGSKRGTGGGGPGWAAGAATKSPQWAWEFLKFVSSAQGQHDEVGVGATTPSRMSMVPRRHSWIRESRRLVRKASRRRKNMSCATRCTCVGPRCSTGS